ncbi:sialate O-acetylesterase-like [Littorina saxatilis]|uniref:sialate O-acetylesterase-like n=1 Tax=Littorina saxatilis TaxID=31220 RepID=UPI0038B54AEE
MVKMCTFCVLLILSLYTLQAHGALKLASYYRDHMVLQRGPQQAVLWGNADTEGDTVTAQVIGQGSAVNTTVQNGNWKLRLPAIKDPGPFVVNVISGDGGHVTLNDVLFGDVWFCSGQSNMELDMNQFELEISQNKEIVTAEFCTLFLHLLQILNSAYEIRKGIEKKNIRLLKVAHVNSSSPQYDTKYYIRWTVPNKQYLPQFSAVCFLFAEYLQSHLNYPIGLVDSAWGGTSIEAWTPHDAVQSCPLPHYENYLECCPMVPEVLYNAMVHPFLDMTIFGVLWYQGETNEGQDEIYKCQIKALVDSWRKNFNQRSLGETPVDFPFGYVQLATGNPDLVSAQPALRWAQTVGYGYSPNPALPDTFMAVAMDLKDVETNPLGPYHPRDKQDVAQRLVLGALNVAYGRKNIEFQGPFPTAFEKDQDQKTLTIEYDHGHTPLDIRSNDGFDKVTSICLNAADVIETTTEITTLAETTPEITTLAETTTQTTWLHAGCSSNSQCTDTVANTRCFDNQCMCIQGYYYSVSSKACIETCSDLGNTYLHYVSSAMWNNNIREVRGLTVQQCQDACNADVECLNVEYSLNHYSDGSTCIVQYVTAREKPGDWTETVLDWNFYQRNCQ